jgi:hypothetical protein
MTNGVSLVAGGFSHTCALQNTALKCWGANDYGQLASGVITDEITTKPQDVIGLSDTIVQISAGAGHTCVITGLGGVKCWGRNDRGQLGNNTTTNNPVPTFVSGLGDEPVTATPTTTPTHSQTPTPTNIPASGTSTATLPPPTQTPTSTQTPPPTSGDNYEPDDTCATARTIPSDGTQQTHTMHQQADTDWISFVAAANEQYVVQAMPVLGSPLDLNLELHSGCGTFTSGQNFNFSPGVRIQFTSTLDGPIYLKFSNGDGSVFGPTARYNISVLRVRRVTARCIKSKIE